MPRILVIHPDGTEVPWPPNPRRKTLQKIVGGDIEMVTVLDRVEDGRPFYTTMIVNENGHGRHLPRNPKATEIYQRNARWQFPDEANAFQAMKAAHRQMWQEIGATIIDATTDEDDPPILGVAIYFEGYTQAEVTRLLNSEEG